ncbi:MAG: HIT family protein [Dehalococcoidia bacterium]|nr:HIT family protein [Dehalococcoidia bacterium]
MQSATSCVFCAIVARRSPASIVYEDDHTLAFMDVNPVNPGHTLVIPKTHAANLADLDADTVARLMQTTQRVERAIRASGVECEATNLLINNGRAAGQVVFHVHMHIIPRYAADRIHGVFHHIASRLPTTRAELDRVAALIAAHTGSAERAAS